MFALYCVEETSLNTLCIYVLLVVPCSQCILCFFFVFLSLSLQCDILWEGGQGPAICRFHIALCALSRLKKLQFSPQLQCPSYFFGQRAIIYQFLSWLQTFRFAVKKITWLKLALSFLYLRVSLYILVVTCRNYSSVYTQPPVSWHCNV